MRKEEVWVLEDLVESDLFKDSLRFLFESALDRLSTGQLRTLPFRGALSCRRPCPAACYPRPGDARVLFFDADDQDWRVRWELDHPKEVLFTFRFLLADLTPGEEDEREAARNIHLSRFLELERDDLLKVLVDYAFCVDHFL